MPKRVEKVNIEIDVHANGHTWATIGDHRRSFTSDTALLAAIAEEVRSVRAAGAELESA